MGDKWGNHASISVNFVLKVILSLYLTLIDLAYFHTSKNFIYQTLINYNKWLFFLTFLYNVYHHWQLMNVIDIGTQISKLRFCLVLSQMHGWLRLSYASITRNPRPNQTFKVAFWHNFPFLSHFRKVNVHHDRYLFISILPTTSLTLWFHTLFDQI